MADESASAFISHASQDRSAALEMTAALEALGVRCWIAPRDIRTGEVYANAIMGGIAKSKVFILLLTDAANASDMVLREVERAANKKKPIMTVRLADVAPLPALEFFISNTHWCEASTGNPGAHAAELAAHIKEEQLPKTIAPQVFGTPTSDAKRRWLRIAVTALMLITAGLGGAIWMQWDNTPESYTAPYASSPTPPPAPIQHPAAPSTNEQPPVAPPESSRIQAPDRQASDSSQPAQLIFRDPKMSLTRATKGQMPIYVVSANSSEFDPKIVDAFRTGLRDAGFALAEDRTAAMLIAKIAVQRLDDPKMDTSGAMLRWAVTVRAEISAHWVADGSTLLREQIKSTGKSEDRTAAQPRALLAAVAAAVGRFQDMTRN